MNEYLQEWYKKDNFKTSESVDLKHLFIDDFLKRSNTLKKVISDEELDEEFKKWNEKRIADIKNILNENDLNEYILRHLITDK